MNTEKDYEAGDIVHLWVNQGMREGVVLGVCHDMMIVEYEMPAGSTALNVLPKDGRQNWGRAISYKSCPKYWLEAIKRGVGGWAGYGQRGEYDFDEVCHERGV